MVQIRRNISCEMRNERYTIGSSSIAQETCKKKLHLHNINLSESNQNIKVNVQTKPTFEDKQILVRRFKKQQYGGFNGMETISLNELLQEKKQLEEIVQHLNQKVQQLCDRKAIKYITKQSNKKQIVNPAVIKQRALKQIAQRQSNDRDRIFLLTKELMHLQTEKQKYFRKNILQLNSKKNDKKSSQKQVQGFMTCADYQQTVHYLQNNIKFVRKQIHKLKKAIHKQQLMLDDKKQNKPTVQNSIEQQFLQKIYHLKQQIEQKTLRYRQNEIKNEQLKERSVRLSQSKSQKKKVYHNTTVPVRSFENKQSISRLTNNISAVTIKKKVNFLPFINKQQNKPVSVKSKSQFLSQIEEVLEDLKQKNKVSIRIPKKINSEDDQKQQIKNSYEKIQVLERQNKKSLQKLIEKQHFSKTTEKLPQKQQFTKLKHISKSIVNNVIQSQNSNSQQEQQEMKQKQLFQTKQQQQHELQQKNDEGTSLMNDINSIYIYPIETDQQMTDDQKLQILKRYNRLIVKRTILSKTQNSERKKRQYIYYKKMRELTDKQFHIQQLTKAISSLIDINFEGKKINEYNQMKYKL